MTTRKRKLARALARIPLTRKTPGTLCAAGIVYLLTLLWSPSLLADTWVTCANEREYCRLPADATGAMVRYGANGVWAYRYEEFPGLSCDNATFGDPKPGTPKQCAYALDAEPRDSQEQALHSILDTDNDPTDLDHSDFEASTLDENEQLRSSNGQYVMTLVSTGHLVVFGPSTTGGIGEVARYPQGPLPTVRYRDMVRLHMTGSGFEVRKNGDMLYEVVRDAAGDTNYALHLTNDGWIDLVDMEGGFVNWRVGEGTVNGPTSEWLDRATIKEIWGKMGWDYTSDFTLWDTFYISNFDNHSHYHAHEIAQLMEDDPTLPRGRELLVTDTVFFSAAAPAVVDLIKSEPNIRAIRKAKQAAHVVSELAAIYADPNLDLVAMFNDEIEAIMAGDMLSDDEYQRIVNAADSGVPGANRRLGVSSSPDQECDVNNFQDQGRWICSWLSKEKNSHIQIQYSLEISRTWIRNLIKQKLGGLGLNAGAIDRVEVKALLTHPRRKPDGRYYQEVRFRVVDIAGALVGAKYRQDVSGILSGQLVSIHDFIIPYTWEETDSKRTKGTLKWEANTGVLGVGAVTFPLTRQDADVQSQQNIDPRMNEVAGDIELTNLFGGNAAERPSGLPVAGGSGTNNASRNIDIAEDVFNETVKRWGDASSLTLDGGTGVGLVTTYDLERIGAERSRSWKKVFFSILMTEAIGGAAIPIVGWYSEVNAAIIEKTKAKIDPLTLTNLEAEAGSMVGDLFFNYYHFMLVGNTDAIKQGMTAWWWGSVRAGFGRGYKNTLATRMSQGFRVSEIEGGFNIEPRVLVTGEMFSKKWTGEASPRTRLAEYGAFYLDTRHTEKCISRDLRDPAPDNVVQKTCFPPSRSSVWIANAVGDPDDQYFELLSLVDGKCLGLASSSIYNRAPVQAVPCDVDDKRRVRWQADYTGRDINGRDNMMLRSAVDSSKCIDLPNGNSSENALMKIWDCIPNHVNMTFKTDTADILRSIAGDATLRMPGNGCLDGVNDNIFRRGTDATIRACDGGPNQSIRVEHSGENDEYVNIRIKDRNRYLDVSGVSYGNEAVVHFWTKTNGDNQDWRVVQLNNGTFGLQARHSQKCLQLTEKNGSTVLTQDVCEEGKPSQQFALIPERIEQYGDLDSLDDDERLIFQTASARDSWTSYSDADRAIDGNRDGYWQPNGNNSVFHSRTTPYWQGDFGEAYQVSQVNIFNRTDGCCHSRLQGAYVLVSDEPIFPNTDLNTALANANAWEHLTGPVERYTANAVEFDTEPSGRYVQIYLPSGFLNIAEVEAFGPPEDSSAEPLGIVIENENDTAGLSKFDSWIWQTGNPSTAVADPEYHTDGSGAGTHQHYLTGLDYIVQNNDEFKTHVYLAPGTGTLQYQVRIDGNWNHRVHWGVNSSPWSSQHKGSLPPTGRWITLTVDLSDFGIQPGERVTGLAWTIHNGGQAWHDRTSIGTGY